MNKRIYGLCEAVILVLIGVAIICFALSKHYGLLMNVRFRWLTVTGAALLSGLGALGAGGLAQHDRGDLWRARGGFQLFTQLAVAQDETRRHAL